MNAATNEPLSFEACHQRAMMLYERNRYNEAAEWFQMALQANPNHAQTYAMLAMCWAQDETTAPKAVGAARQAVSLEPDDAHWHAILSVILCDTAKPGNKVQYREALEQSKEAVALDPDSDFAHATQSHAHIRLEQYREAEAAAKLALSLNIHNSMATQSLSIALLNLGKTEDHESLVQQQLQNRPDDDLVHTSAGWQALSRGKHQEANKHFMEALRLDPMNEAAREGLIESFRARSFVYRWYWQFGRWVRQVSGGRPMLFMIGGYIAYRLLNNWLKTISPALSTVLVMAWLTLALWSFLARGIGSALMLTDRFARMSLRRKDYLEGLAVGGMTLIALITLGISFIPDVMPRSIQPIAIFAATIPVAVAMSNDHPTGRWLYGIAGATAAFFALGTLPTALAPWYVEEQGMFATYAIIIGVVTTWLASFRVLYR